jgi:protein-S-isoprenylcysteine O-methyltransferase Ste14
MALWIAAVVLGALTIVSFIWSSVFYFRFIYAPDTRKRWLKINACLCMSIAVVGFLFSCHPPAPVMIAGMVLLALSLFVFWGAILAHRGNRPAFAFVQTRPSRFVRRGPYRLIRHPFYASYLLFLLAAAFVGGFPLLILTVPWLGAFYYFAAREEERSFRDSPFARDYRRYARTTGMFWPRMLPVRRMAVAAVYVSDRGRAGHGESAASNPRNEGSRARSGPEAVCR